MVDKKIIKSDKIGRNRAIIGLVLNVISIPGLGTLISGKITIGIIQMIISIISLPLMFILIGIPFFIGVWIWALVTSMILKNDTN